MSVLPSPEEVAAAQTEQGGWARAQLAEWGVPWPPPRGWRRRLAREHEAPRPGVQMVEGHEVRAITRNHFEGHYVG